MSRYAEGDAAPVNEQNYVIRRLYRCNTMLYNKRAHPCLHNSY